MTAKAAKALAKDTREVQRKLTQDIGAMQTSINTTLGTVSSQVAATCGALRHQMEGRFAPVEQAVADHTARIAELSASTFTHTSARLLHDVQTVTGKRRPYLVARSNKEAGVPPRWLPTEGPLVSQGTGTMTGSRPEGFSSLKAEASPMVSLFEDFISEQPQ